MRLMEKRANFRKYQGGWLKEALAIGGAVFGFFGKRKADKRAGRDRERELEFEGRRVDLAEQAGERSDVLFKRYMDVYAPREEQLLGEAFDRPIDPAAEEARATTDVRSSLATAREMGDRNQRRLGVNPNSGAYVGLDRARGVGEAKVEAGARTRARSGVRDLNFARQSSIIGLGRNLPVTSAGFAGQAAAGMSGVSNLASYRSASSQRAAGEAGEQFGGSLVDAATSVYDWWKGRQQPEESAEG